MSLFAYAVKLAQKYHENNEEDNVDNVVHYLSNYIARHLLDFVESEGGWVRAYVFWGVIYDKLVRRVCYSNVWFD